MARIKGGRRSNLGRPPDIGRPEWIGRMGAARLAGEGQSGALGVGLGRGLAVGHDGGTRNPLVGLGMGIGARLRPAAAQGGVVSPESGVLSPGVDYRPSY